jgi:hypothetical protein
MYYLDKLSLRVTLQVKYNFIFIPVLPVRRCLSLNKGRSSKDQPFPTIVKVFINRWFDSAGVKGQHLQIMHVC